MGEEDSIQHKKRIWISYLPKVIGVAFWVCLIILCLIQRDRITVENIVNFTPKNPFLAVCVILLLFALKSVSMVIYGGILYAASGILFSIPAAIAVNLAGSVIMTTIPFLIGKRSGVKIMDRLIQRNSKLEILQSVPKQNEWLISFFVRIVGVLPSDLVSMYLGASGLHYTRYMIGTIVGQLPAIIDFSVMGKNIHNVSSPAFRISVGIEIFLMILSVSIYYIWKRKRRQEE